MMHDSSARAWKTDVKTMIIVMISITRQSYYCIFSRHLHIILGFIFSLVLVANWHLMYLRLKFIIIVVLTATIRHAIRVAKIGQVSAEKPIKHLKRTGTRQPSF